MDKHERPTPREMLAEIQARLEMCEEDLDSKNRAGDVAEETDEIVRLLEEMMEDPNTTPAPRAEELPLNAVEPETREALLVVDVQNDFCPGGTLAVREGDQVVPVINRLMGHYPLVVTTQDWHPPDHISFTERGGPWPPHCVAGTAGAELHPNLDTSRVAFRILKGDTPDEEAYSGFHGTDLAVRLRDRGVTDVVIAGLTTDYCVRTTALDAIEEGFGVTVVADATRAVDVNPGDGARALEELRAAGAKVVNLAS